MTTSVASKLKNIKPAKPRGPLWKGPEEEGITQSMIARWLVCRERFRLTVIEGLREADRWDHKSGFGNMWHVCEEALAVDVNTGLPAGKANLWENSLRAHVEEMSAQYMLQREEISNWAGVCRTMFPLYVEYWAKHGDVVKRTPLLQEQVFCVPYKLPSGRVVKLRGRWDSVDLIDAHTDNGKRFPKGVWLQENKSKRRINESQLLRQLRMDLQTMLYLIALEGYKDWNHPILGTRYNVAKRPSQYQGKKETRQGFLERLSGIIAENPGDFFMRWKVDVRASDIQRFRQQCLDPILENVTDDAEWWIDCSINGPKDGYTLWDTEVRREAFPQHHHTRHFRMPYGVYSPLLDGGMTELDEHLETGSMVGLQRVDRLFTELD